jgi:hypothetical protein
MYDRDNSQNTGRDEVNGGETIELIGIIHRSRDVSR